MLNTKARNQLILFDIAVFAIALVVRLYRLGTPGFWLDEVLQSKCAILPFFQVWDSVHMSNLPLPYYLHWLAFQVDVSEFWGRLPSALLGSGFVAAMFHWLRLAGGWRLAIPAAILLIPSPIMVRFAQEARPYAVMFFGQGLLMAGLWGLLRRGRFARRGDWLAVGIALFVLLWSQMFAWIYLFLLGIIFLVWIPFDGKTRIRRLYRGKYWGFGVSSVILAGCTVFPLIARRIGQEEKFYAGFDGTWEKVLSHPHIYTLGYDWYEYIHGAGFFAAALFVVGLIYGLASRRRRLYTCFCFAMFIGQYIGLYGLLYITDHWIEPRYFLGVWMYGFVICVFGLVAIARFLSWCLKKLSVTWCTTTVAAVCAIPIAAVEFAYTYSHPIPRGGWREAVQFVSELDPDATIMVYDSLDHPPVEWYADQYLPEGRVAWMMSEPSAVRSFMIEDSEKWFINREDVLTEELDPILEFMELVYESETTMVHMVPSERMTMEKRLAAVAPLDLVEPLVIKPDLNAEHFALGWYTVEQWENESVRAMNLDRVATIFVPLASVESEFEFTLNTHVYGPALEKGVTVTLYVDREPLETMDVHHSPVEISWTIPAEMIDGELTRFDLVPSLTVAPADTDPASEDTRQLSFWVRSITLNRP